LGKVQKDGNNQKDGTEIVMGQGMTMVTNEYDSRQLDSLCNADSLPIIPEGWIRRTYSDYETNEYVIRYMYIKEMTETYELIYIVTIKGDMYIVNKRQAKISN
jgi:hypothetical protein